MPPNPDNKAVRYAYYRRYGSWVIYEIESLERGGSVGTRIKSYQEEEEARREVYRLNGWKNYKPKNKKI